MPTAAGCERLAFYGTQEGDVSGFRSECPVPEHRGSGAYDWAVAAESGQLLPSAGGARWDLGKKHLHTPDVLGRVLDLEPRPHFGNNLPGNTQGCGVGRRHCPEVISGDVEWSKDA